MNRRGPSPRHWSLPLLLAAATTVASLSASVTGRVGLQHDDNVSVSLNHGLADAATTAGIAWDHVTMLGRDWQLSTNASLDVDDWWDWNGLDLVAPGARLGLRRKFGFGPYAPSVQLSAGGEYRRRDYAHASGTDGSLQLTYRQRFTPLVTASLDGELERFDARDAVYARTGASLRARVDLDFTSAWRLTLTAARREGDVTSHYRPGESGFGPAWQNPWSGASATDSLFGSGWIPYRYDAATSSGGATLSHALNRTTTLAAGFDYASTSGKGRTYLNRITSVTLVHAF